MDRPNQPSQFDYEWEVVTEPIFCDAETSKKIKEQNKIPETF